MLAIGRALMMNPNVLMLDEPSMGLAPIIVEQIFEIIQELNQEGMTIAFWSNKMPTKPYKSQQRICNPNR